MMSTTLLGMGRGEAQNVKLGAQIKHSSSTPFSGKNLKREAGTKTLRLSTLRRSVSVTGMTSFATSAVFIK